MTAPFAPFANVNRWVMWLNQERKGKFTKIPYGVHGRKAQANHPETWISRREATQRANGNSVAGGIGIQLGDLDGKWWLGGLDLDSCIDSDGTLAPWAEPILAALPSYAETSPSGKGIKAFFYVATDEVRRFLHLIGVEPNAWGTKRGIAGMNGADHGPGIELYLSHRFFAVTERLFPGRPEEIHSLDWPQLERLAAVLPAKKEKKDRGGGRDTSRSAKAFGLGTKLLREGKTWAEMIEALLDDTSEIGEWARTKGAANNNRELLRIWEKFDKDDPLDGPPEFSEDALASRFTDEHAASLKYVSKWGRWLLWNGSHWQEEDTLKAYDLARGICREASGEAMAMAQAKPNYIKLAAIVASASTVAAVERLAKADRQHARRTNQWDKSDWLFNAVNTGTIDLKTGRTYAYKPDDYMTKIGGCAFNRDLDITLWRTFLDTITSGNNDLQQYLQRVAGYCLTGCTREHALFFLYGTGSNGKGVFLNTLRAIWGDYAEVAPMEMFCETKNERHPTDLADLRGARLVIASETEQNQRWAEAKIKSLTGGDPVKARFMRQDFFEFTPQFKLAIAGNHKPSLRGVDEAIRRRMNLIPFTVTILEEERDPKLPERLKPEHPGILAWAVQGCIDWQAHGLNPPAVVRDATEKYLAGEDKIGRWVEDNCGIDPVYKEYRADLYANFVWWCEQNGESPISQKRLSATLIERGYEEARDGEGKRQFAGIGLKLKPSGISFARNFKVVAER